LSQCKEKWIEVMKMRRHSFHLKSEGNMINKEIDKAETQVAMYKSFNLKVL